jgi:hypothetical protein
VFFQTTATNDQQDPRLQRFLKGSAETALSFEKRTVSDPDGSSIIDIPLSALYAQ